MDIINKLESKQKGYITGDYAIDVIKSLACSQGCWGRLLRYLYEDEDVLEEFKKWVEEQQFTDDLDLIMRLEGN